MRLRMVVCGYITPYIIVLYLIISDMFLDRNLTISVRNIFILCLNVMFLFVFRMICWW